MRNFRVVGLQQDPLERIARQIGRKASPFTGYLSLPESSATQPALIE